MATLHSAEGASGHERRKGSTRLGACDLLLSSFSKPIVPLHLRESDFESGFRELESRCLMSSAPTRKGFSESFVCERLSEQLSS
jgi:hypothetical protein